MPLDCSNYLTTFSLGPLSFAHPVAVFFGSGSLKYNGLKTKRAILGVIAENSIFFRFFFDLHRQNITKIKEEKHLKMTEFAQRSIVQV